MAMPDLTTVIVVGAMVGLLCVAFGYAHLVWLTRHHQAREAGEARRSSPLRTWLLWVLLVLTAACLLRSVASSRLSERSGFLVGEDLVSVRPRPGLVARFEPSGVNVQQGQFLIRFTGEDGEAPQLALEKRLELLKGELEIARGHPLEFDPELVRREESARTSLENSERRMKQLASERDAIARERTQRRLDFADRIFRIEHDDRTGKRELAELVTRVDTERSALASDELLASQGALPERDAARGRDALSALEGRIAQFQDLHAIRGRERRELENLRSATELALAQQVQERSAELENETARTAAARSALALAQSALDQDRPRAEALRERRLRQIQIQLDECQALLEGRGRQLNFQAPWNGRIGFREPSPASPPSDNGPLLVLYRPGKIAADVRLEPGEAQAMDSDLHAEIHIPPSTSAFMEGRATEDPLAGTLVQKSLLPDGSAELRFALDPPERIVRQLAMGGIIPVVVDLRHPITHTTSFRIGVGLAVLAIALALFNAFHRRTPRRPVTASRDPVPGGGDPKIVTASVHTQSGTDDVRAVVMAMRHWLSLPPVSQGAPVLDSALALNDFTSASELGVRLRMQVDGGVLTPTLVRQVGETLARGGYHAAALVSAGYGAPKDPQTIELAAFSLLATAPTGSAESLAEATRDCAQFIRIMRAISPRALSRSLDRLRETLIAATLEVARRSGAPSETAGNAVTFLVEV